MPMPSHFWTGASETFGPWTDHDRFSSHAPFHFDLSIFDLFVSCRNAATLVADRRVAGQGAGSPGQLPCERGGSASGTRPLRSWPCSPEHGGLNRPAFTLPALVLFAGEVFPVGPLRRLRQLWPQRGSGTFTDRPRPMSAPPIRFPPRFRRTGRSPTRSARSALRCEPGWWTRRAETLPPGTLGELVIAGPGVMRGYFGQPELTARAFFIDEKRCRWYRTGDLVVDDGSGCYQFHGRRDRMVKKRGYRIELGEIEAAIYRHDGVDRAAVVAKDPTKPASRSPRSWPSSPTRRNRSSR